MPASTDRPSRHSARTLNGRRTRSAVRSALDDLDRLRSDAGWSLRTLATAADLSHSYLSEVLRGGSEPTVAVLVALSRALGADLSIRVYPNAGPIVRDPIQARIVEAVLHLLAPTWRPAVEVAVRRPVRGFVDVVLADAGRRAMVATEVQSRIDRVEQLIRWSRDKAAALTSSDLWQSIEAGHVVSQLLIVRSTTATREIARRFGATLEAAYPARSIDVFEALTTVDAPWPGAGILWAMVDGDAVRILARPPRGVSVGR